MRRRLRKKCHLGEFREDRFNVTFSLSIDKKSAQEEFLDQFVAAIEVNGLVCGGSCYTEWNLFVTAYRGSAVETDRTYVLTWLERQPMVKDIVIGPLIDTWWGGDNEKDAPDHRTEN